MQGEPTMNPRPDDDAAAVETRRIDATLVAALRAGDAAAWRTFLLDHHVVFERSLRLAGRRAQVRLDVSDPSLCDDAKVYFYEAITRSYREFLGEGQFFAFLHRTVQNFVFERRRGRGLDRRIVAGVDPEADDHGPLDERAAQAWRLQRLAAVDPALSARLDECMLRLPAPYRAVVWMHHYEAADEPLQNLATVLGATVEAIHKRYQRALTMLRECLASWSKP